MWYKFEENIPLGKYFSRGSTWTPLYTNGSTQDLTHFTNNECVEKIDYICETVSERIGVIRKVTFYLPPCTLKLLANALPFGMYCQCHLFVIVHIWTSWETSTF